MIFLVIFAAAALIVIALITILNMLTFPRLRLPAVQPPPVRVSILIPARNEAEVIAETIQSLLTQNYPDLELILLDDHSSDGTAEAARSAANGNPRLKIMSGETLPAGWLGKNWACHQLSQAATGDVLIFTDADVHWHPDSLAAVIAEMERAQADLLTVWSTQHTETWSERLVVPLMALVIFGYLPSPLVHHTPWAAFAAANGQCLAFRRSAYDAVGGHTAVRGEIVEDITLARLIKRRGLRLHMADGNGLITCRMYHDWREVREGYAKNIIAGYGGHVSTLAVATLFHWLLFLAPWVWLVFGLTSPQFPIRPLTSLALIALGIAIRALTALATRQRMRDAFLMPVSALLMTIIAAQAVWWQWRYGGPRWKGRSLTA